MRDARDGLGFDSRALAARFGACAKLTIVSGGDPYHYARLAASMAAKALEEDPEVVVLHFRGKRARLGKGETS